MIACCIFSQLKISFINQNQTSFIRDCCCHLTLCKHLIEPNCFVIFTLSVVVLKREPFTAAQCLCNMNWITVSTFCSNVFWMISPKITFAEEKSPLHFVYLRSRNKKMGSTRLADYWIRIKKTTIKGSSCSKVVERTPAEQNFWGRGFDSCQALGFFSLSIP